MAWVEPFLTVWPGTNNLTFMPQESPLQTRDDHSTYLWGC